MSAPPPPSPVSRIVLDPCVLIAAAISRRGSAGRLVNTCHSGQSELVVSPHLLWEVGVVLARRKFRPYLSREQARAFVAELRSWATVLPDPPVIHGVSFDRSDDYLVALARAGDAAYLVSIDHDLLDVPGLRPPVVSPRWLLPRLSRPVPGIGHGLE